MVLYLISFSLLKVLSKSHQRFSAEWERHAFSLRVLLPKAIRLGFCHSYEAQVSIQTLKFSQIGPHKTQLNSSRTGCTSGFGSYWMLFGVLNFLLNRAVIDPSSTMLETLSVMWPHQKSTLLRKVAFSNDIWSYKLSSVISIRCCLTRSTQYQSALMGPNPTPPLLRGHTKNAWQPLL